jgi:hypothetical protein
MWLALALGVAGILTGSTLLVQRHDAAAVLMTIPVGMVGIGYAYLATSRLDQHDLLVGTAGVAGFAAGILAHGAVRISGVVVAIGAGLMIGSRRRRSQRVE